MIDKNIFTEKSLSMLNIRSLRKLGRQVGVPSPTNKKKDDLVDYILKIIYGEVEASAPSIYGRPASQECDIEEYLDILKKSTEGSFSDSISCSNTENDFSLKLRDYSITSNNSYYDVDTLIFVLSENNGYLRRLAFVESDNDIKINKDIIKKYKLEHLDVVEIIQNGNQIKIVSVNGKKVTKALSSLEINGQRLQIGTPKFFHLRTKEEINENILQLVKQCKEKEIKILMFTDAQLDLNTEDVFYYNREADYSKIYKQLMCLINKCNQYIYQNEEFVLALDDYGLLEKVIRSFDDDVSSRIKKYLQEQILSFASLGNIVTLFNQEKTIIY